AANACGTGGVQCAVCANVGGDSCVSQACRCGSIANCGAGDRCVSGACICDSLSCQGCCQGTSCQYPGTLIACGTGGSVCAACDTNRSNACGLLGCQCGGVGQCASGVQCINGF